MSATNDKITPLLLRSQVLFESELNLIRRSTDRLFCWVMLIQWMLQIIISIVFTPQTWISDRSYIHPHVWQSVVWGALVISFPCLLALKQPGLNSTRLVICVGQAMASALIIHLMDGRIDAHFHVFVSIGLLSFYRDWTVLALYSCLIAMDHFVRGIWWPYSVYGTDVADPWRFIEHGAWMLIEDVLMFFFFQQSLAETLRAADRQARFEFVRLDFETQLAEGANSLRISQERFELALRGSKIGMFDWQRKTNQVVVSAQVNEIIGLTLDNLTHTPESFSKRLHPDDRDRVLAALAESFAHSETFQQEFRVRKGDREYAWVECRGDCTSKVGGVVDRFTGGVRDITTRKELEVDESTRVARIHNSQKLEAVGSLAGGIAHEFNNLIQAIRGFTEISMEGLPVDDSRYADLTQVLVAADRAASLTRQLLGFSRNHAIECSLLQPALVIEELVRMLRPLIGSQVVIRTDVADQLGTIVADPVMMQQMLLNLCINARDAMPDGGCLLLSAREVDLDAKQCLLLALTGPGTYVRFDITDNGCGIKPEIQQRIFEPFFTTKEVGRGTGLGLSMVYGMVQQHRGAITVKSKVGVGTTFQIYLPVSTDCHREPNDTDQIHVKGGCETVLIAEEEPMIRTLMARILNQAGYRVLSAADGVEALELYSRHEQEIGLAILDAIMPRLMGHRVLEQIRLTNYALPVIISTGFQSDVALPQFVEDENVSVVEKPFTPDQLLSGVRKLLDRRHSPEKAA